MSKTYPLVLTTFCLTGQAFGQFLWQTPVKRDPAEIKRIVGTNQRWPVALLGVGNLGNALLGYAGFAQQGFEIVAAFDNDASKVGRRVGDVPIFALQELADQVAQLRIRLGMITVPSRAAQAVADQLVDAGVVGIVNFAPVTISVPENVSLVGVDLAIELEQITFSVVNRDSSG